MRLVIAEKHSVATAIANALDPKPTSGDGCIQAGQTLVSWAQGHLVDLATPDAYEDEPWHAGAWRMEDLPIDPIEFQWQTSADKGAAGRYRQLVALMRRNDVDTLVNACDPDREGEAIFRRIVDHAGIRKPTLRLWVASLEETAIRQAWQHMKPASEYDGLAQAADARAKADWLVGMNATRAHTIQYGRKLTVGRVQTPTLAMIAERDQSIAAHKPIPFWRLEIDMDGGKLASGKTEDRQQAERWLEAATGSPIAITRVERKRERQQPPTLYDLTALQKDMSSRHGLTASRTLKALESLYLSKLTTYPRTDSKYITHDDLPGLEKLLDTARAHADNLLAEGPAREIPTMILTPERTVDDTKVAGHTAILPTMKLIQTGYKGLDGDQKLVASRIVNRMLAACAPERIHDTTKVTATTGTQNTTVELSAGGDKTIDPGWTIIDHEGRQQHDAIIPETLAEGQTITPIAPPELTEGESQPPKPFTEASLLNAMEHASRYVEDKTLKAALDDDTSHSGGIGTPATRADIIEKLVAVGYVERKGKQLRSTPQGRQLVNVVTPSLKDVKTTAQWESMLADIEHGRMDEDEFLGMIRGLCMELPDDVRAAYDPQAMPAADTRQEEYGPCPRCGKPVVRTGSLWQCSTNHTEKQSDGTWKQTSGCGWKAFATISGKKISDATFRKLLTGGTVKATGLISKRTGKTFTALLVADSERGIGMRFDDTRKGTK